MALASEAVVTRSARTSTDEKGPVMKHAFLVSAVIAAAVALLPAAAGATAARGVVVARSHSKVLLATRSGSVVQMKSHASVGSRLVGGQVAGRANKARIHGIV